MKNKILDYYVKHVEIDPKIESEDLDTIIANSTSLFNLMGQGYKGMGQGLSNMFKRVADEASIYKSYHGYERFKTISGNKVIYTKGTDIFGVLDNWWPSETFTFDITNGALLRSYIFQALYDKFGSNSMKEIYDNYKVKSTTPLIDVVLPEVFEDIKDQEWYVINMGDPYNSARKRPIKIREIQIENIDPISSYSGYRNVLDMKVIDKKTKEQLGLSYFSYGWHAYPSKDILKARLEDIETLWLGDWDKKVENLGNRIKAKEKELESLKKERSKFMNTFDEYKKNVKGILWRDF